MFLIRSLPFFTFITYPDSSAADNADHRPALRFITANCLRYLARSVLKFYDASVRWKSNLVWITWKDVRKYSVGYRVEMGLEPNLNRTRTLDFGKKEPNRTRTVSLQTRQEPEQNRTLIAIEPWNRTQTIRHPTIQTAKETQPYS